MMGRENILGMSPLQIRVIALCLVINILDGFDIMAMAYTAPAVGREWGLTPDRVGALLSLGLAGMVCGSLLLAPLADRFGRRPVILGCLTLSTIGMFAAAWSGSFILLGFARFLTGLAIGGILPSINTLVAEYASPRARSLAVALMQAGFTIGAALGGLTSVLLLTSFGWQSVFLAGAVISLVLLPLVFRLLPESLAYLAQRSGREDERNGLLTQIGEIASVDVTSISSARWYDLFHVRHKLALIVIAFFFSSMGFYFLTSWTPKLLADKGLSENMAVTAGTLLTAGGLFAAIGIGWLSLRRPINLIVVTAAVLSATMTVAMGHVPSSAVWMLSSAFVAGLMINATHIGIYAIIPAQFPAHVRASATGIVVGLGRLGAVIGPLLAGHFLSAGWTISTLFLCMAAAYLIVASVMSSGTLEET